MAVNKHDIENNRLSKGFTVARIHKVSANNCTENVDSIIAESPLQIIIAYGAANARKKEVLSVTMRTPGNDFNMVTGFLFCEGLIHRATDILSLKFIGNPGDEALQENTMLAELAAHVSINMDEKKRNFISSGACGFCGKTNADLQQQQVFLPVAHSMKIAAATLYSLPLLLQSAQSLFSITGGAHAVALANEEGRLLHISEDVGRHNAMDKLVGAMLKENALPLKGYIVLFSGRLSYELMQKSIAAGISVVCSIGAPSSLAVELAEDFGITLIGFLKNNSFNIYNGAQRVY